MQTPSEALEQQSSNLAFDNTVLCAFHGVYSQWCTNVPTATCRICGAKVCNDHLDEKLPICLMCVPSELERGDE